MRAPLRRRWPMVFAAACALSVSASLDAAPAGPATAGSEVRLDVATFRLKNGLTLLVHEDHGVPIVAVELWYRVGSKDERPGRTGFAHLFEHLMFQGSAHVGDDQHLTVIAQAGGAANAETSQDRTSFYQVVPANHLETVLWLESDRMGFLAEGLTQESLDSQRGVVRNERRESYENRPYGMAAFAIHESVYPEGHPYHHLPIGSHADLEAATLDDVRAFFRDWYTPANAVLVIAGDVRPARARELVEKWFGGLPSHGPPTRPPTVEVALPAPRRVRLTDEVSMDRIYLAWPSPRWFAPGDAELDLLSSVLGGTNGRLYRTLVYEKQIAQSVQVAQASGAVGSLFEIVATARPGHSAAEVERAIDEQLARLLGELPVTDDELARARSQWEAGFVYGLEGLDRRADLVAQYFDALGDGAGFDRDRQRYLDARRDGVLAAARRTLGGPRVTVVVTPQPTPAGARPGTR